MKENKPSCNNKHEINPRFTSEQILQLKRIQLVEDYYFSTANSPKVKLNKLDCLTLV